MSHARHVYQKRYTNGSASWLERLGELVLAGVIVFAVLDANFGLRIGALICAFLALRVLASIRLPDTLAVAYASFACMSLFWTDVPDLSRNSAMNVGACVAVFLAVRAHVTSVRGFLIVALGFLVGSVVTFVKLLRETDAGLRWTYQEDDLRLGIDGLNVNYSAYGLVTAAALVVAMVHLRSVTGRGLPRWLLLVMLPIVYVGVLFNGTRGALVSLALLLVWWIVSRINPTRALKLVTIFAVVANLMILMGWLDAELSERVISSGRETGDLNGRLTMWPVAREVLWAAPLVGRGVGALPGLPENPLGINAHSAILDVGSGLGLIGILLFGSMIWVSLARACRDLKSPASDFAVGAFLVVSLPVLMSGFWIESPVLWGALALVSRVNVFSVIEAKSNQTSGPEVMKLLNRARDQSSRQLR